MARCSATLVALSLIAALLGCAPPHGTLRYQRSLPTALDFVLPGRP